MIVKMKLLFASGVCIIEDNKLLLLKQKADRWGPPAGHAEESENLVATAVRETKEETGLNVSITGLIQAMYIKKNEDVGYIACFYAAEILGNKEISLQENEVEEYVWAEREEIEQDKYKLRDKLLKTVFLKAFNEVTSPVDTFTMVTKEGS